MPSEKPRIAAYIPKELDERVKAFQAERGLKSESQTLTVILSEFFGVAQQIAHSGSPPFNIAQLKTELLSELQDELFELLKPRLRSELLIELQSDLLTIHDLVESSSLDELPSELPEQLELATPEQSVDDHSEQDYELQSELEDEPPTFASEIDESVKPAPLNGVELSRKLRVNESTIRGWRKKGADTLASETKERDGKFAWSYDPATKLYCPL